MEAIEDIIIVGAGVAGLATALGLHRLGIRSRVLESSDELRTTGFALVLWPNAWRALDALGVGDSLRLQHYQLRGVATLSSVTGLPIAERSYAQENEVRCVQRKNLLETLERELPDGTVRYSSKVECIEDSGHLKMVHLADGSILKTKVLIGCDGVNSVVAKCLGLKKPAFIRRSTIRGCRYYEHNHGFNPKMMQYVNKGIRSGFVPCDDKTMHWFLTWSPSSSEKDIEWNTAKMMQLVLDKLGKVYDTLRAVVENTEPGNLILSQQRMRYPWELLWGSISKDNLCVAGDAFHPMTPDIGQGGCSALEDGVVLARCLGEALRKKATIETEETAREEEKEYKRIKMGLKKYAKERRWRAIELITTAYIVGFTQQRDGKLLKFLREKVLGSFLVGQLMRSASFDCGKLSKS